jgi:chorismate-pyruvate lyase
MADVVDPTRLLDTIKGFSPWQRVLLGTAGTLQGTLSAYFGAPVTVEVRAQHVDGNDLHREVDLVCKERRLVACSAVSDIHVDDARMRELIIERNIGLGQISALLDLRTTFELLDAGRDDGTFWREYLLSGERFRYRIHERFPTDLYASDT